jgi:hypothetical protein
LLPIRNPKQKPMKPFEQAMVVLRLSEALKARGSWGGETHLQKSSYFLQELLGVPTGFEFILYKHGPFSFDLRSTLTMMEAEDLIAWEPRRPYGPTLVRGSDAYYLDRHYGLIGERYSRQIDFVADRLGDKDVRELEKLSTALFVIREGGDMSKRAARIVDLKPHITVAEAVDAVQVVDEWISAVCVSAVGPRVAC